MKSELRQDLVSGDWVLISPGRGKRPSQFKDTIRRVRSPKKTCIFEDPSKAGGGMVILSMPNNKNWRLQAVPNKYPAVTSEGVWETHEGRRGPFFVLPGYGHHELVITRDHDNNFPKLIRKDATLLFQAFMERYKSMAADSNMSYISIFHNWGPKAGASVYHPHYQILGIPVIPPDIERSLNGSLNYAKKNKDVCVHCTQIEWEKKQGKRVLFENKDAISFAPFVSKEPFEMRVFPKKHRPYFEKTKESELKGIVEILHKTLQRLEKRLGNPDYNFFIHTAPVRNRQEHDHYHWHIEIFPRTNISAGFELGTTIEINPLDPDEAIKYLR